MQFKFLNCPLEEIIIKKAPVLTHRGLVQDCLTSYGRTQIALMFEVLAKLP